MSGARILGLAVLSLLSVAGTRAATFEVDPSAESCDDRAGLPFCTLRAAMTAAGARPGPDTVVLAENSVHTLTVPDNQEKGANGLPIVRDILILRGDGRGHGIGAVIERADAPDTPPFRLLQVAAEGSLELHRLTLRNGDTRGLRDERDGAGIWNLGTLTVADCRIEGNVADGDGGGLRNDGTARIERSTFSNNEASGFGAVGGGLTNLPLEGPGVLTLQASTLSGNRSDTVAGGFWNEGTMTVTGSTVSSNAARQEGGGLRNNGSLELIHVTLAGNVAGQKGGGFQNLGDLKISNSIVAGNSAPDGPDGLGCPAWEGVSLLQDPAGCPSESDGLLVRVDPRLGPLQDNGGPTFTRAPEPGSPVLDAAGSCTGEDQRGVSRGPSERCDLGAYETVSRLAVQAGACEPRRPDCSVAAALAVLADGGTLALSEGRHPANLRLVRSARLEGAGAGRTILDGGGAGRVLMVEEGAQVVVRGITVTGGRLEAELERDGGGIWNAGDLTLERCEVTGNAAVDDGGGIRNDGTLTVSESTVRDNQAARRGGVGGGIYNPVIARTPTLRVVASTISGNSADDGGGIWCQGSVTLVNSTVSGNSAGQTGGGIRNNGDLSVSSTTIALNRAGATGGGIHHLGLSATLANTILAGNSAETGGADCYGAIDSGGHNLLKDAEGCGMEGELSGIEPGLAPLGDNGGPTPTHALSPGSAAVDVGPASCEPADQRGNRRPADGDGDGKPACDVGAFEARADGRE